MPFSTIDSPKKYFDTSLYTGTGSSQSISNLNFQPDFTWIKGRSGATDHALYDAVRGVQKDLVSNATSAETTQTTGLTAFGSTGFTIGALAKLNTSSATYCSWNWLGANTTVSNTSGSITSTVSANTTSGFSVVKYTGTGSLATVGHGLGVAPKMILIKVRNNSADPTGFVVYHASNGANYSMNLNTTNAKVSNTTSFSNTSPTSTVFSVGDDGGNWGTNFSTYNFIAYCFAEVKGFSKAFSYTGNGSTDGSFVYCGFRPAWVMLKYSSGASESWAIFDNKRNVYNPESLYLYANTSGTEGTETGGVDFLSNGFKIRNSYGYTNNSGGTYIGFAIAEQPYVSSKGIVANAR